MEARQVRLRRARLLTDSGVSVLEATTDGAGELDRVGRRFWCQGWAGDRAVTSPGNVEPSPARRKAMPHPEASSRRPVFVAAAAAGPVCALGAGVAIADPFHLTYGGELTAMGIAGFFLFLAVALARRERARRAVAVRLRRPGTGGPAAQGHRPVPPGVCGLQRSAGECAPHEGAVLRREPHHPHRRRVHVRVRVRPLDAEGRPRPRPPTRLLTGRQRLQVGAGYSAPADIAPPRSSPWRLEGPVQSSVRIICIGL